MHLQVGYTHSNYIYTDQILHNITSWDFTSSYPYCLLAFKYPSTKFKKCFVKDINDLDTKFAYLIHIEMYNLKSKYFNHFLSQSKCYKIKNGRYDNGRIISADYIEITVTDIDLKIITSSYTFNNYNIIECYYSKYDYLPKEFLEFILEKYKNKTKYKNVKGMEVEYSKEKNKFNSLYGMSVTNTIRDDVVFDPELMEWQEVPLTNEEIKEKLFDEEKKGFLSFSYGCWCTAYGRYNLITKIQKLDRWAVYSDTDSIKLKEGYDKSVIDNYNKEVEKRIENVSKALGFDIDMYKPKDQEGQEHMLGVFDFDGFYDEFITQGAKKYAVVKTIKNKKVNETYQKVLKKNNDETSKILEITVAGVPKQGVYQLNGLEDFKDDLVFEFKNTNKNMLVYVDNQEPFCLTDYLGNQEKVIDVSGCCLVPITYTLGKSVEYEHLLTDDSSKRARYNE